MTTDLTLTVRHGRIVLESWERWALATTPARAETRPLVPLTDLSPTERAQFVQILAGREWEELTEVPIEWWELADGGGKVHGHLWLYLADCGLLFAGEEQVGYVSQCNLFPYLAGSPLPWPAVVDAVTVAASRHPDTELSFIRVSAVP